MPIAASSCAASAVLPGRSLPERPSAAKLAAECSRAYLARMADHMDSTAAAGASESEEARRARLAWEAERIEEARASIRAEGTIPHEEIRAWVDSWDTPGELPQPRPRRS